MSKMKDLYIKECEYNRYYDNIQFDVDYEYFNSKNN